MEPEELPTGTNKSDEQKLSPDVDDDKEYIDEFFSGTSGERPVTPGQDSDPVKNSNMQKQIILPVEVVSSGSDSKVLVDDDSQSAEACGLEQTDATVKEPSDEIIAETNKSDQIDKSELQSPVSSGIPDIIHDPLIPKPTVDTTDGVPTPEAGGAEFMDEQSDKQPLIEVSHPEFVGEECNSKTFEEEIDRDNHIAAINIVQELLNQALENNGGYEDGFRPMFDSDADDGEHPVDLPVKKDNGDDSGTESIHDGVTEDVEADNLIIQKDCSHELMADSSEGFQETAIQQVSGPDLTEDGQMEENDLHILDVAKSSPTPEHPIHDVNAQTSEEDPKTKESEIFESGEPIQYNYSNSHSPHFLNKSDDDDDDDGGGGNRKTNAYRTEESSSIGFQRFEKCSSPELTPTEDVPSHSLDQKYPVVSLAPDDIAPISHTSENVTDEYWLENERKEYSRIPTVSRIEKHKPEVDSQVVRQIPLAISSSSQFEMKPPRRPASKNLTGTHESHYLQGSNPRATGESFDTSIGGSYSTGGVHRDEMSTRSRSLLSDAQHSASWSPGIPVSPPSSGPIPGYRSLQDQQISWLQMFKILEKQHRKELQSQYVEHQRLIEGIQVQMERDLHKQQESLHQRLEVHREMLNDSTASDIYNDDRYYRLGAGDGTVSSIHSVEEGGQHGLLSSSSMPVRRALDRDFESRTPSPSRGYASLDSSVQVSSKLSPRRSPRRSPVKSPVSEVRSEFVGEKMLRGGVYSTPMPISRGKNTSRSFSSKSENRSLRNVPISTSPVSDELINGDIAEPSFETRLRVVDNLPSSDLDDSYLASSTKLREKHIKAMADLRSYYESELQDLRDAVTCPLRESARERILQDENQEVKRRCDDLEEDIHNTKIRNRELEQKIHGLEIRSNDYADRYDDSQRTVLSLKNRLEELHSYAKDRDQTIEDLEINLKKQSAALQEAYQKLDEFSESSRREKTTLQRVLEKYEGLEKEYNILKEARRQTEEKYYNAKNEVVDLNKVLSKLELQVKQLNRENDNLQHKATVAMNMASVMTSYEDSFGTVAGQHRGLLCGGGDTRSSTRSPVPSPAATYRPAARLTSSEPRSVQEPTSDTESEKSGTSPLIKAERELQKLRNKDMSQSLSTSYQKKYYGSEMSFPVKHATEYEYSKKVSQSPKYSVKQSPSNWSSPKPRGHVTSTPKQAGRETRNRHGENAVLPKTPPRIQIQPKKYPSPTRFDVELDYRSKQERQKVAKTIANSDGYPARSTNDVLANSKLQTPTKSEGSHKSVADTLERVRAGNFVSRPQWEDVHTSLVKSKSTAEIPISSMTREQRLEERIQAIDKLEKKYGVLQAEKRKLESALTRIPTHGHLRQKEEIEDEFEKVDRELGSVRMSLKRFQVIKSTI